MLPTMLGMASLRHTSRLRMKTGQKRSDRLGARQRFGLRFCVVFIMRLA